METLDGRFQHALAVVVEGTMSTELAWAHQSVAEDAAPGEALELSRPRGGDAATHFRRRFPVRRAPQLRRPHGRRFDVEIDAVEEWPGDASSVAPHLGLGTETGAAGISEKAARTFRRCLFVI